MLDSRWTRLHTLKTALGCLSERALGLLFVMFEYKRFCPLALEGKSSYSALIRLISSAVGSEKFVDFSVALVKSCTNTSACHNGRQGGPTRVEKENMQEGTHRGPGLIECPT